MVEGWFFPGGIDAQNFHSSNFLAGPWSGDGLDEDKKPLRADISLKNLILEYQINEHISSCLKLPLAGSSMCSAR